MKKTLKLITPAVPLTERETGVLRRLRSGQSQAKVAAQLGISQRTVSYAARCAARKFGMTSSSDVVSLVRDYTVRGVNYAG